ncbi:UPF0149 family protein [Fulvimonas soli]|uniref:YecA family protein n=1 Tax=Fulvimonas soli TaxID=155197 RepID=A0A316HKW5_9GAMM|nr:UPF0149 family protein [Fulvimonas soli]PWK81870.1 hypothetical protein C7456_11826 [Fulvimonas soli]TNY27979.1 hypothetical protein BV497_00595 [Fulvimonas soli]
MTAAQPIDYDELDTSIRRLRLSVDASELHGSLCGFLAGGGALGRQPLLAALQLEGAEAAAPSAADQALFERLGRQAETELADPELGFEPLLPADDRPLDERADALVEWCRGFLGGFGLAGAPAHAKLSEEAQEILRDLGTIAAAELDFGDAAEDEDALIEVHEFVRMGAMLLFAECRTPDRTGRGTLH